MLVLAMKFSRCAAHHRPTMAGWGSGRTNESAPTPQGGRSAQGCSLKTEQKDPVSHPVLAGGRILRQPSWTRFRVISDQLRAPLLIQGKCSLERR